PELTFRVADSIAALARSHVVQEDSRETYAVSSLAPACELLQLEAGGSLSLGFLQEWVRDERFELLRSVWNQSSEAYPIASSALGIYRVLEEEKTDEKFIEFQMAMK